MQKCLIYGKGGRLLGKPNQIWNSTNKGGGGSQGPLDPDFNHVNENSRFWGEVFFYFRKHKWLFRDIEGQLGPVRVSQSELGSVQSL